MSEIVNLRRARKEKARDAKEKEAANNRAKHGVAKPLRDVAEAQAKKSERDLDAHKLDNEK
jgi:hypothetical protein